MRPIPHLAIAALLIPLTAGCGEPGTANMTAADSTDILFSVTGLDGPEAVRYDPAQDVYFVANFGVSLDEARDANGYISRVAANGELEAQRFMTGTDAAPLHMPRGMHISGDTLFVADVDGVHGFHRETGAHVAFVDFTAHEPGFLNDVAIGPAGAVYVTDTGLGRVYRMTGGVVEVAVEDSLTGPPNGITWDADRGAFLLAPWGSAPIRAWTPGAGGGEAGLPAVVTVPGGRFDGIELVDGGILVASQDDTSLWLVTDGEPRRVITTPGRPADIGVDTRRGRVAVPYISLNRVDVWALP